MKSLKTTILSLSFLFSLSFSAIADTSSVAIEDFMMTEIEDYLSTQKINNQKSTATVYSDFLVKDADGFIYTIDFLITNDCELIVLSAELEEEYYRINHYNITQLKTLEVSIAEAKKLAEARA